MPTESRGDYPVLLWWAECVDLLGLLTPRNRARVLSLLADDVRKGAILPVPESALVWPTGGLSGCGVLAESPRRTWHCQEPRQEMRIIG